MTSFLARPLARHLGSREGRERLRMALHWMREVLGKRVPYLA